MRAQSNDYAARAYRCASSMIAALLSPPCSRPGAAQARAARAARKAAEADRRDLGRPVLRRPVRRISQAFHRRLRAAADRRRVSRRLSEPCRDRDLPRPFDDPHRHATRRTPASSPTTGSTANDRRRQAVYCAEDESVPGSNARNYTASDSICRADARRPDEGGGTRRARSLGRGQGPRRGDDGRHNVDESTGGGTARPSHLVLSPAARRPPSSAAPRIQQSPRCSPEGRKPALGACRRPPARRWSSRTISADRHHRPCPPDRPRMSRTTRNSEDHRLPGQSPRLAAVRRDGPRARRAGDQDMKLGHGPATDIIAIGAVGDRLYRPYATAPRAPRCASSMAELDRTLGGFFDVLDATGVDYEVVLTADHGAHRPAEREHEHARRGAARSTVRLRRRGSTRRSTQQARPHLRPDAVRRRSAAAHHQRRPGRAPCARKVRDAALAWLEAATRGARGLHPRPDRGAPPCRRHRPKPS